MKKPREQNIDKCKIFDYFAKKTGYHKFRIYVRQYSGHMFGINAYDCKNRAYAMFDDKYKIYANFANFACKKKLSKWDNFMEFELKDLPREFKEAVIDHCVDTGISVIIDGKIFIYAISCLEELAIKVELET